LVTEWRILSLRDWGYHLLWTGGSSKPRQWKLHVPNGRGEKGHIGGKRKGNLEGGVEGKSRNAS